QGRENTATGPPRPSAGPRGSRGLCTPDRASLPEDAGLRSGPTVCRLRDLSNVLEAKYTLTRRRAMKVMVSGKATADTEAGVPPGPGEMEAMSSYIEALVAAGIIKEPI